MTIVTLSSKGQLVLPREIREALGLRKGDQLRVTLEKDRVVLTRHAPLPGEKDWEHWRGHLAGTPTLQEYVAEHAAEVTRDERMP